MSNDFELVLPDLDLGEIKDNLAGYEVIIGIALQPTESNAMNQREAIVSLGIKEQLPLIQTTTMDGLANTIQQLYNEAADRLNLEDGNTATEDHETREEEEVEELF